MPPDGLIEMPPESKHTPLPMNATGAASGAPPRQRMITTRLPCPEPCPTASSARMPIRPKASSSSSSTSTPSLVSASVRAANSAGNRMFGGSFTRSRARFTPSARPARFLSARRTAASSATPKVMRVARSSDAASPLSFFFVL